ncbi:hypothetical protein [Intestinimonas butyriciproducens]|uniref:hypothetical protein n=1 Tax=Intestinimonas butyriciproducens TaxID=1297617 RepID=UPI00242B1241|nr:hypothetical protein [Intestinimonas butyriciproducens]
MNFTDSQYEREMKKKPKPEEPAATGAPDNSRCGGCSYWQGIQCVSCYRDLLRQLQAGR